MVIDTIIIMFLVVLFYVYWLNPRIIKLILNNKKKKGTITDKDIDDFYKKWGFFKK